MKETNGLVEVVFIMDRSGSMSGMEEDTIGGFNSMLKKQKKESDNIIWTTVLFDHEYEVVHDRIPIQMVKSLTEEEYYTRGTTALLDAVGKTIKWISACHRDTKAAETPTKTLFVITTDGYENDSRCFTYKDVKKMVEERQEEFGWEFIFLGADIDAVEEARRMGIHSSRAARFHKDRQGIRKNSEVVCKLVDYMASGEELEADCLEAIRDDYEDRIPF